MRKSKPRPTAERVRELFHYDPETGVFTHRETKRFQRSAPMKYGQVGAGRISTFGYVVIKVDGVTYAAALLAWLYVHGKWPKGKIKYLNGNRADNKISNIFVHETPAGDIAGREMTQERLKELLHYEPETGWFTWRVNNSVAAVGQRAGGDHGLGYRSIGLDYKKFLEHKLAWLYMTGEWPEEEIDHINRDRADNRWPNLKRASRSQNGHNKGQHPRNTTGYKGVYRSGPDHFVARIQIRNQTIHLGRFKDINDAIAARKKAEEEYQI